MALFEGDHHWLQAKLQGGTQPTHQQKTGLKIYKQWPCFTHSKSLHQEASTSLLLSSIRGQTEVKIIIPWLPERKPQSQKTNQSDHMDHSLCNSMKLWVMLYRAIQDEQVILESSNKRWSTAEGNGKLLQYSALKIPQTVWKCKKIWYNIISVSNIKHNDSIFS